jgi:hypothetical protein
VRLPEAKIKEAFLHPLEEIRLTAVGYFADAHSQDESVMPLVVQAVEKHGRGSAFSILRDAERLPQTAETVDWLVGELRRDYDLADMEQDNYRFAVAIALCSAPHPLLWKRLPDILTAPAFPKELADPLSERLDMFTWDWERAWRAFLDFERDTMRRKRITSSDARYGTRIAETLARHKQKAKMLLRLLAGEYEDEDEALMEWARPSLIDVVGMMRLEDAVPLLLDMFEDDDLSLADSAATALERIGGDTVVREIDAKWWETEGDFREGAACILSRVRGDLCEERCLTYLAAEEAPEVQLVLGEALLDNFSLEAIDPVWSLVADAEDDELVPDERGLRYMLVATATIMGRRFPHFDQWHKDASRDNWGRFDLPRGRLADSFRPDEIGPKQSGNGKRHY